MLIFFMPVCYYSLCQYASIHCVRVLVLLLPVRYYFLVSLLMLLMSVC